jgi:hypothetical protein
MNVLCKEVFVCSITLYHDRFFPYTSRASTKGTTGDKIAETGSREQVAGIVVFLS